MFVCMYVDNAPIEEADKGKSETAVQDVKAAPSQPVPKDGSNVNDKQVIPTSIHTYLPTLHTYIYTYTYILIYLFTCPSPQRVIQMKIGLLRYIISETSYRDNISNNSWCQLSGPDSSRRAAAAVAVEKGFNRLGESAEMMTARCAHTYIHII